MEQGSPCNQRICSTQHQDPRDEARGLARPVGVEARYLTHWQSRDGVVHYTGSMRFHFAGERIAQVDGSF